MVLCHRIWLIWPFLNLRSDYCLLCVFLYLNYMSLVCFLGELMGKEMVYVTCCCFIAVLIPGCRVFCCQLICAVLLAECRPFFLDVNNTLPVYPWEQRLLEQCSSLKLCSVFSTLVLLLVLPVLKHIHISVHIAYPFIPAPNHASLILKLFY